MKSMFPAFEKNWCCQTGLNCRPLHYQWSALPLSYGSMPVSGESALKAPTGGRFLPQGPLWRKHAAGPGMAQKGQKGAGASRDGGDPVPCRLYRPRPGRFAPESSPHIGLLPGWRWYRGLSKPTMVSIGRAARSGVLMAPVHGAMTGLHDRRSSQPRSKGGRRYQGSPTGSPQGGVARKSQAAEVAGAGPRRFRIFRTRRCLPR